jgi:hypothetical protein
VHHPAIERLRQRQLLGWQHAGWFPNGDRQLQRQRNLCAVDREHICGRQRVAGRSGIELPAIISLVVSRAVPTLGSNRLVVRGRRARDLIRKGTGQDVRFRMTA